MNMDEDRISLQSVIKIEKEEFQEPSSDDILRTKAGIFTDPFVLLKRYSFSKETTRGCFTKIRKSENRRQKTNNKVHNDQTSFYNCFRSRKFSEKTSSNEDSLMFCDSCPKTFRDRISLKKHVRYHGKKRFFCKVCDYKCVHKSLLKQHEVMHAPKEFCKICNKYVTLLQRHLKSHKSKEACPICKKMLSSFTLKVHIKNHSREKFQCEDCNATFGINEEMKKHRLLQHYNGKVFKCHCGAIFARNWRLANHQRVHGTKRLEARDARNRIIKHFGSFICDFCKLEFEKRMSLLNHMYSKHKEKQTMFSCDLCLQAFDLKCNLAIHMEQHHLKLRRYKCNMCEFEAYFKSSLNSHKLIHSKKTECPICHKMVAFMGAHMKCHVKVNCPICHRTYSKASFLPHLRIHNGTEKHKCKICQRTFHLKSELKLHFLKTHYEGERFECHCGALFENKFRLKYHAAAHKEKVSCRICETKLNVRGLKGHFKSKHPGEES